MPGATGTNGDNEVVHDFSPLLLVYKSGRLERPLIMPFDLPGHDAATGVESKDVPLSPSTFVRLYLPAEATSSRPKPPAQATTTVRRRRRPPSSPWSSTSTAAVS